MKSLFADESEYEAFLKSYEDSPAAGVRLNPWKGSREELLIMLDDIFSGDGTALRSTVPKKPPLFSPVPWEPNGFYYEPVIRPGKHPFHEMGLYYIQEPSAMSAVPLLDPQPGERILDLCAAPGGKTTQIAGRMCLLTQIPGKMRQCGLLVSNEIHPARAKILSQNVERMGLSNVLVTNETPERLSARFPAYFDRILVDAPCSGEGMFRKNPEARLEWSSGEVTACADRQRHLLDLAASMLRPGGRIVYSTCTFSKAEDEDVAETFLAGHKVFHSCEYTRFFPHRQRGEGHFVAVLEHNQAERDSRPSVRLPVSDYSCDSVQYLNDSTVSNSDGLSVCRSAELPEYGVGYKIAAEKSTRFAQSENRSPEFPPLKDRQVLKIWEEFSRTVFAPEAAALFPRERLLLFGEQLYLAPEYCPKLDKLKILRPGLHLGTLQKGRLVPSHALALFLKPADVRHRLLLPLADERVARYFAGDVINCENEQGWTLVCVEGFSAGWGKASGGVVKNHYPKALRKKF
ncbi:MAG: RsmF rRNA methyltransferase first C-terminal domain-containing protein [Lachnospiraceae bacterium]|nr:RsmF rRNA methyltransferase first C-terminal domain-containing protein [Lachnospiraceae bacterium]